MLPSWRVPAASSARYRPSASAVPSVITSSTVPMAEPASPSTSSTTEPDRSAPGVLEQLEVLDVGVDRVRRELVDDRGHGIGDATALDGVRAEPVEGVLGESDPLGRRIERVDRIRVAHAHGRGTTQRVVGGRGEAGTPLGAGVDAELADRIDHGVAAHEHDRVIAVEEARRARLVGRCEDGGARRRLGEHVDVSRGDRAREGAMFATPVPPLKTSAPNTSPPRDRPTRRSGSRSRSPC